MASIPWTTQARFTVFKVVQPTLAVLEKADPRLASAPAAYLLVGTAAAETGLIVRDQNKGPALGLFQVEPHTFNDVYHRYLQRDRNHKLLEAVDSLRIPSIDMLTQLSCNPAFGCAIARIKYWTAPEPLPNQQDVAGLGRYWKTYYNTSAGKGTVEHFIEAWDQYIQKPKRKQDKNNG